MVVLHPFVLDSEVGEHRCPIALDEKAALVTVDRRLQQDRPV
jgi:hypothetical protein